MNRKLFFIGLISLLLLPHALWAKTEGKKIFLLPSKDTFFRSNKQIRNGGGGQKLYISENPKAFVSLIAFDLSTVSNKILRAELRVHQGNDMSTPLRLVVSPMVNTINNAKWGEGKGNLGTSGQNSRPGDACYLRSAYPDTQWESARGTPLRTVTDSSLWLSPLVRSDAMEWKDAWIVIPINDAALLERIRTSNIPQITFGFWGTSGNGIYALDSRESAYPAELHLIVEEKK